MKSIFILGVALNIIICRGPRQRWRDSLSASRRNIYRLSFRIVRTKLSLTLGSGSPLPKSKILTAFLWVLLPKSVGNDLRVVPPPCVQRLSYCIVCTNFRPVINVSSYRHCTTFTHLLSMRILLPFPCRFLRLQASFLSRFP